MLDEDLEDPLGYWKINRFKYPNLIKLVKKYLCIPATSTESERTFSNLNNLLTKKRLCMKGETVNAQLFLKDKLQKNAHLFKKKLLFFRMYLNFKHYFLCKKSNRVISFFYLATNQISHTCQLHDFGRVNLFSRPVDWPAGWQVFSRLPSGWKNLFRDQHW